MNIVPSLIVAHIDRAFPNPPPVLSSAEAGFVRGLEALISRVDPILLPSGEDNVTLTTCRATMMSCVRMWESQGNVVTLDGLKGRKGETFLAVVRGILAKCPDEPFPKEIKEFEFIRDESLRLEFRRDLASIDFLVRQQQWKPAMVIAGALMEALLLHLISAQDSEHVEASRKKVEVARPDVSRWHLPDYVKVAADLQIIGKVTEKQCLLSGDLRNLIHPGKAIRAQMQCNKATAQTVIAGLYHVIDDAQGRPSPKP